MLFRSGIDTTNMGPDQLFSAAEDQVRNAVTPERIQDVDDAFRKAQIVK